ncbi:hypothetical protein [Saccharothrix xinjiangensis]|uniref:hypothetical protein n=1 Tax=Saccharothrix xinjiangensis TaxID=204798 RepID=UPI0031D9929D
MTDVVSVDVRGPAQADEPCADGRLVASRSGHAGLEGRRSTTSRPVKPRTRGPPDKADLGKGVHAVGTVEALRPVRVAGPFG